MKTQLELMRDRAKLIESAKTIKDRVAAESREYTDDERSAIDDALAQADALDKQVIRLQEMDALNTRIDSENQRLSAPARPHSVAGSPRIEMGKDYTKEWPAGIVGFGEFLRAVHRVTPSMGGVVDKRLYIGQPEIGAALTTYGSEGIGADGGFLVPVEYAAKINAHSLEQDAFLPLTDNYPVGGNAMSFPRDETTPWGTNGIRAYWDGEAAAATQTKPVIGFDTLRLNKLQALVPITDELLQDTTVLGAFVSRKTGESIRWKTNNAFVNGTGVGQPQGILSAACLVSVAKESSQTATTINAQNVSKMFGRMPSEGLSRAVWLINNDAFPQLTVMTLGNQLVYMPPQSGLVGAPAGTLLGRPVIMSQACQTLGTKGDIYFVDWGSYATITKSAGIEAATSIHLYFDQGATAFRATFRCDGRPWLTASITPANGSNNMSPFISLDTRA